MFSTDGKISKICKSCEYRHVFGGSTPMADWSNTLCNYSIEKTDSEKLRRATIIAPTISHERGNADETESHNEESGNHARSV